MQCGTCPVCRQSLTAGDETAATAAGAESESESGTALLSSSSQQTDTQENLPVVTLAMEMSRDVEMPVLSPNSVIYDVEYFETEVRL